MGDGPCERDVQEQSGQAVHVDSVLVEVAAEADYSAQVEPCVCSLWKLAEAESGQTAV